MDVEPQPCTTTPTTDLDYYNQVQVDRYAHALQARTMVYQFVTSTYTTNVFVAVSTTVLANGITTVGPVISTSTVTLLTETLVSTSIDTTSTQGNPQDGTQGSIPKAGGHNKTKTIVGGVVGATGVIILGLVIFFVLRRKLRLKAIRSASAHNVSTPSNVLGQRVPESAQLSTTPRPFLDFPVMQNRSPPKGTVTNRERTLLEQNSSGDIGPANPFRDPVLSERGLSDDEDESQRVRDVIDNLRALASQFEGELRQLGALVQSGQLSTQDRLELEEIRRTTGLTIQFDSNHYRFSIVRSASSGSSSSLAPPSYRTHGS